MPSPARSVPAFYRKSRFTVKRPIRSFCDLEVYQRTAACATEVLIHVVPLLGEGAGVVREKLVEVALRIPESIAAAHSRRFERDGQEGLNRLEETLEACNRAVVYLEQARDLGVADAGGRAVCDDLSRRYLLARRKTLNLLRAWQRGALPWPTKKATP